MTRFRIISAAAVLLLLFLPSSPCFSSGGWQMEYSDGTSLKTAPGVEWLFTFPKCDGHVNMITRKPWWGKKAPKTLTMTVQLAMKGKAHFRGVEQCPEKPPWTGVRFYLQRSGDNMTCAGDYASYRWWSNPVTYRLEASSAETASVTVKVKPNQWSNCWGKPGTSAPDLFWKAWANPSRVGVTLGPSCRAGHGVCTDKGSAVLKMVKFK